MPNWCTGSLKLKGNGNNILRFIKEKLNVYETLAETPLDKKEWLKIEEDDNEVNVYFHKDDIYIEDTNRAFLNLSYDMHGPTWFIIDKDKPVDVCAFLVSQAWGFRISDWTQIAKEYDLDIKLYGIECGAGFVEDYIITDHGETVIDNSPQFTDCDDYAWNCPFPWIGG